MNNKKMIRKIIINSLLGFPVGITILMINYIFIYFFVGKNIFMTEIAQLQNIVIFILQLTISGISYYLYFIAVNIIIQLFEAKSDSEKYIARHPYKTITILVFDTLIYALIFMMLFLDVFTDNITLMNIASFAIIFIFSNIYRFVKVIIDSSLVNKINKKLKEINN